MPMQILPEPPSEAAIGSLLPEPWFGRVTI
jgi:hypothetical protein